MKMSFICIRIKGHFNSMALNLASLENRSLGQFENCLLLNACCNFPAKQASAVFPRWSRRSVALAWLQLHLLFQVLTDPSMYHDIIFSAGLVWFSEIKLYAFYNNFLLTFTVKNERLKVNYYFVSQQIESRL